MTDQVTQLGSRGLGWREPIADVDVRRRAAELAQRLEAPSGFGPVGLPDARGDRWAAWRAKAVALGAPLPEVPSWALRDPRLADPEWAVIAALSERGDGGGDASIVQVTAEQIARQIIDPNPLTADVATIAAAIERLRRFAIVIAGRGVLVLRPQAIPMGMGLEPRACSDKALLEWIATLSEDDAARAKATLDRCRVDALVDAGDGEGPRRALAGASDDGPATVAGLSPSLPATTRVDASPSTEASTRASTAPSPGTSTEEPS